VVFYEDLDYALGIREFLENYFYQESQSTSSKQNFFNTRVEGRCGYIRQAYAFVFQEYDYNKMSLFLDGVNAQYSDIDFYDATREGLGRLDWKFDFSLPYYFQLNPYLDRAIKFSTQYIRHYFIDVLDFIMSNLFEKEANSKGTILQMFENIKNQYVGKPHQPHSHMIEYGIHAITIKGSYDPKIKAINERERVLKTIGLMEHLFRVNDQVDEHLHAGYYFYLLTSKVTFVSNSGFVYPLVAILFGFFIPNFIQYYEHMSENDGRDEWLLSSGIFIVLSYALGFLFMITPNLYLEYLGKADNLRGEFCLAKRPFQDEITRFTLLAILGASVLYLILFKLFQPSEAKKLWFSIKSNYWWPNLVFAGSLVVYQFAQSLVMCLFIFPLIQSAYHLRSSFTNALQCLLMVSTVLAVSLTLLFGSYFANPHLAGISIVPTLADPSSLATFAGELLHSLTREAILDYDCSGSNVWVYLCLHIVPSLIIFVKILTN
jgi:Gaa1-like, GPI transamidase component